MKIEEAKMLVRKKYKDYVIDKITNTEAYFLISIRPKLANKSGGFIQKEYDGCLKAVDKKTKQIFTYHPILHGRKSKSTNVKDVKNQNG